MAQKTMDAKITVQALKSINNCSEADTKTATDYVEACLYTLTRSSSFIAGLLINGVRRFPSQVIDTMAVHLPADGFAVMTYDPEFVLKLAGEQNTTTHQAKFVLYHEALHLVHRHLYAREFAGDQTWIMATEATINRRAMQVLKMGLPVIDGKTTGVDPDKIYQQYRKDLREQGKTALSADELFASDLTCFYELKRMSKPPKPPRGTMLICQHGDDSGDGTNRGQCTCPTPSKGDEKGDSQGQGSGDGDQDGDGQDGQSGGQGGSQRDPACPQHGSGGSPRMDQTQVDNRVERAIEIAMNEAHNNGNRTAKKELLELSDASAGSERASKIWGNAGLGALRGEPIVTRSTNYWQKWVENRLADRLEPGLRLVRQRKIWWEERFQYNGDEPHMVLKVFIDTSGSMPNHVIDWVSRKIGETEGLTTHWYWFDAQVGAVDDAEGLRGGGGTSFQSIVEYLEDDEETEEADAILVFTDGHAPPIAPDDPEKWIWLITPGGSTWPDSHSVPMECYEIDLNDIDDEAA